MSPSVDLPYGRQSYTDLGSPGGRTLLLVHGWGADERTWASLVPLLRPRYRVLTLDVRGHGRSARPPGGIAGFDPEAIAGDLSAVLDACDVGRVVAVGHSWGGQLVTALAATHPERVAGLVVLDPACGAESEEALLALRERWYAPDARAAFQEFADGAFGPATPEEVRAQVRAGFRDTDPRVLADAFVAMYLTERSFGLRTATAAYLTRVRAPTLSVYSTDAAAIWARSAPAPAGSQVVVWSGAGHYLHQERPAKLADLLGAWLARRGLL